MLKWLDNFARIITKLTNLIFGFFGDFIVLGVMIFLACSNPNAGMFLFLGICVLLWMTDKKTGKPFSNCRFSQVKAFWKNYDELWK
jgi:apolipoprotein N-acyltransferase